MGVLIVSAWENTPVTAKSFWHSTPAVKESAQYVCNNCKTFPCMWELQLKEKRVWDVKTAVISHLLSMAGALGEGKGRPRTHVCLLILL
jgi:hypothetical protein